VKLTMAGAIGVMFASLAVDCLADAQNSLGLMNSRGFEYQLAKLSVSAVRSVDPAVD
jgi:hypothetical protein